MNKKIKGYEVMKLIAEKQIKVAQGFLFTDADGVEEKIFWDGENFKYSETERDYVLSTVGDVEFAVGDFEILEDEEEIDIQGIEEITYRSEPIKLGTAKRMCDNANNYINAIYMSLDTCGMKINELVRIAKQLDKKINKED
ncbi:MAG: hypothetical protein K6B70_01180 [Clostridia bacterium]|nr:hypothetical protein [Clostridia bacterium]